MQNTPEAPKTGSTTHWPLVVDLDGTLTPTDTLVESVIRLVRQSPMNLLRLPVWLLRGRAAFKDQVAANARLATDLLPYRAQLVNYLQAEKAKGRQVVLATAAHESIAQGVARHLGLFDRVLATNAQHNLKGRNKLAAIQREVGKDFVYAGDHRADLPIWEQARGAVLVGASSSVAASARRLTAIEQEFPAEPAGLTVWAKTLRVHQWVKNLLLFVPLLTAFSFTDPGKLLVTLLAFGAFSLAASATYIVNDLWDLESDRVHQRKRARPFASARIPIQHGLVAAVLLLTAGLLMAAWLSPAFLLMLVLYVCLTSAYSWALKEYVLIDVIMLSLLYTLRILAGAVAIQVPTSSWLLAFSVFMFLSLALVKRCSELVALEQVGQPAPRGRDYRVTDLVVLWPLGMASAMSAVVVFGLFISTPDTQARYATPNLLWIVALGLIYWLARLWVKTARKEMHDDPVVYAIKDRGSRVTVIAMGLTMLASHFFAIPILK